MRSGKLTKLLVAVSALCAVISSGCNGCKNGGGGSADAKAGGPQPGPIIDIKIKGVKTTFYLEGNDITTLNPDPTMLAPDFFKKPFDLGGSPLWLLIKSTDQNLAYIPTRDSTKPFVVDLDNGGSFSFWEEGGKTSWSCKDKNGNVTPLKEGNGSNLGVPACMTGDVKGAKFTFTESTTFEGDWLHLRQEK